MITARAYSDAKVDTAYLAVAKGIISVPTPGGMAKLS